MGGPGAARIGRKRPYEGYQPWVGVSKIERTRGLDGWICGVLQAIASGSALNGSSALGQGLGQGLGQCKLTDEDNLRRGAGPGRQTKRPCNRNSPAVGRHNLWPESSAAADVDADPAILQLLILPFPQPSGVLN